MNMIFDENSETGNFPAYIKQHKSHLPLCIHKLEVRQAKKQKITGKKIMVRIYTTKLYSKKTYFKNITRFL